MPAARSPAASRLSGDRGARAPTPREDRLTAGAGADKIDARDGVAGDRVTCGAGRDTVQADRGDRVARDCERVTWTRARR